MQNIRRYKKNKRLQTAQSVVEYFLILLAIVAAILGVKFIDKVRFNFGNYFSKATTALGNGAIPPVPVTDTCTSILSNVAALEDQISELSNTRDELAAKIADLESEVPDLQAQADELGSQAAHWEAVAAGHRASEASYRSQASSYQDTIDALNKDYNDNCVVCASGCYDPDTCSSILSQIPMYESLRDQALANAEYERGEAEKYEKWGSDLRTAEASVREGIVNIQGQLPDLKAQRDDLDASITDKQNQINNYKATRPECF